MMALWPLPSAVVTPQHRSVTTARVARPAFELDAAARCVVLIDTGPTSGLALLPRRRRDLWLARLRRGSLDARLAAGEAPESTRLLATRAMQIISAASRRRLARRWDDLATRARRHQARLPPEIADQVQQVADLLRTDQPVDARGVARAITTLDLASDALQRARTGGGDVAAAAVRSVITAM
jgi:hypothetical protein